MIFDKIAQTANLLDSIFVWNRDQNWLVKSAAGDLHLATRHERANALDVLGMLFYQPFEQRAGIVQP